MTLCYCVLPEERKNGYLEGPSSELYLVFGLTYLELGTKQPY